jgi:hypothetical protein
VELTRRPALKQQPPVRVKKKCRERPVPFTGLTVRDQLADFPGAAACRVNQFD